MTTLEQKVKERAYYMFLNNVGKSNEERYYNSLAIEQNLEKENSEEDDEYNSEEDDECNYCDICCNNFCVYGAINGCGNNYYCKDCVISYVKSYEPKFINKRSDYNTYKIRCPDYDCQYNCIYIKDVMPETEYNKLGTIITFSFFECNVPNCGGKLNGSICQKCNHMICLSCGQDRHNGKCKKEDKQNINLILETAGNDIEICPNCNNLIFRSSGCNSMFCWHCSVIFNWKTREIEKEFSFTGKSYYTKFKTHYQKTGNHVRLEDFNIYGGTEELYFQTI
jgi:hypothetical protein